MIYVYERRRLLHNTYACNWQTGAGARQKAKVCDKGFRARVWTKNFYPPPPWVLRFFTNLSINFSKFQRHRIYAPPPPPPPPPQTHTPGWYPIGFCTVRLHPEAQPFSLYPFKCNFHLPTFNTYHCLHVDWLPVKQEPDEGIYRQVWPTKKTGSLASCVARLRHDDDDDNDETKRTSASVGL